MIHDKHGPKVCTETTCWFSCSFGPLALSRHNNSLQNNAKVAAPKPFEWILSGFPVVGYTCSLFNCHGTRLPLHLPFASSFFLLFLPRLVLLFSPVLPISLLGIFPCIIHEWHACFTRHVPTALLWRPEGVSTKPACNLLTQGAASSQLSSPITFISWTGPSPWHQVCCDHCVI